MNRQIALKILGLLLLIALAVYLFIHFDLVLFFTDRVKIVQFILSYPYHEFIFILIQITQVVAAPIPGELTGLIGGYIYGPLWGTLYSTIGLTIGSWIAFSLARRLGEPLLKKPQVLPCIDAPGLDGVGHRHRLESPAALLG